MSWLTLAYCANIRREPTFVLPCYFAPSPNRLLSSTAGTHSRVWAVQRFAALLLCVAAWACSAQAQPAGNAAPAAAPAPWLHAYAAYRRAEVPEGLQALRLRQSRRAQRRHAPPAQPGPAHELRQVQLLHDPRQRAGRHGHLHARAADRPRRRRAAHDVRLAGSGDARRARPQRHHVSPAPAGAFHRTATR